MRRLEQEEWWDDLVSLKDELSLRELSERFKVTPSAISNALRRNRLERRPAPSGPRAYRAVRTKSMYRISNDVPPTSTPEPLIRPGSKDSLLQPAFHLLGKLPDAEIAERCGVSIRTVASYRARHNIAGYSGPRKRQTPTKKVHQSKIDAFANLIGIESDKEIARRAGVTLNAVRHYRMTRGIIQAGAANRPVDTSSRSLGTVYGWMVRFEKGGASQQRVVTGDSLETVAQRAKAAGLGAVIGIERLGVFMNLD